MPSETLQILAVWKEHPSLFASGMMQWVAEVDGPDGRQRIKDAPAFPLDDKLVDGDGSGDEHGYIQPVLDRMEPTKRNVVEEMLADFVHALEREGWVRSGQGSDWFNLHFEREHWS